MNSILPIITIAIGICAIAKAMKEITVHGFVTFLCLGTITGLFGLAALLVELK